MGNEESENPDTKLPEDEEDVIEMAGAGTEAEKNLAIAQARLIGDI